MTAEPIAVRQIRYKCPFCPRTHSRPVRAREHIGRCWLNPDARGCKTCKHFESAAEQCCGAPDLNQCYTPWCADVADRCRAGVSLAGRPACGACSGSGEVVDVFDDEFEHPVAVCPACDGDSAEVKPGPIVHCEKWEAKP